MTMSNDDETAETTVEDVPVNQGRGLGPGGGRKGRNRKTNKGRGLGPGGGGKGLGPGGGVGCASPDGTGSGNK